MQSEDRQAQTPGKPPGKHPEAEETFGLDPELILAVDEALDTGDREKALAIAEELHDADLADLIQDLPGAERQQLTDLLEPRIDPDVLTHMDPHIRAEVIARLGPDRLVRLLIDLDSDDAVEIFEGLEEESQRRILAGLPQAYRHFLEESLTYPEDSAGRLMQREMVVVPSAWTVGDAIDYLRATEELPDDFYDLFVVDPKHRPVGSVPLSRAMRAAREVRLTELMERDFWSVPLTMDQEEVAYLFRQYGLVSVPVVDDGGRIVGVITVDDAVQVIDEEASEDIFNLAGLAEPDLYSDMLETTKARAPWLFVNLLTAVLASLVIGLFDATIEKAVALAVLMPIVASMGGNGGTQTLTVAVRALAMKDLHAANARRFIGKELIVGLVNGLLFALLTGLIAWLWFSSPLLGLVIAAAMIINMVVAGLSGTLIPLGLERIGADPAIASTVFLTTVTDVVGFFAFLGLAAVFLL